MAAYTNCDTRWPASIARTADRSLRRAFHRFMFRSEFGSQRVSAESPATHLRRRDTLQQCVSAAFPGPPAAILPKTSAFACGALVLHERAHSALIFLLSFGPASQFVLV